MAKVIVTHEVKDFGTWKPIYEADEARRSGVGVRTLKVSQGMLNPNKTFMYWEVDDLEVLGQMLSDPDLKVKMEEAGVTGPLDYCVLD